MGGSDEGGKPGKKTKYMRLAELWAARKNLEKGEIGSTRGTRGPQIRKKLGERGYGEKKEFRGN